MRQPMRRRESEAGNGHKRVHGGYRYDMQRLETVTVKDISRIVMRNTFLHMLSIRLFEEKQSKLAKNRGSLVSLL